MCEPHKLKSSVITHPSSICCTYRDKAIFTLTLCNFLLFKICKVRHTLIKLCLDSVSKIICFLGVLAPNDIKSLCNYPLARSGLDFLCSFNFRWNQIIWIDLGWIYVIYTIHMCVCINIHTHNMYMHILPSRSYN